MQSAKIKKKRTMNAKQLKTKGIIKPTIFEQKPVEPQKNSLKKLKNFKKKCFSLKKLIRIGNLSRSSSKALWFP